MASNISFPELARDSVLDEFDPLFDGHINAPTKGCETQNSFDLTYWLRKMEILLLMWAPVMHLNSRPFGNFLRLRGKRRRTKIGFYFFTYEWSRRRLPLIKMIHGVEEVLILLFTAFGYEYLFWSTVVRVWVARLFVWWKIQIVEETHDKKKEEVKPKLSGEKNVSTKVFRVCRF